MFHVLNAKLTQISQGIATLCANGGHGKLYVVFCKETFSESE